MIEIQFHIHAHIHDLEFLFWPLRGMLIVLLRGALSACSPSPYIQGSSPPAVIMVKTEALCVVIADSLFQTMTYCPGAAISYTAPTGFLAVLTTSFVDTHAVTDDYDPGVGGAIYMKPVDMNITACCFRGTTADTGGTAVYYTSAPGAKPFNLTSFVGCNDNGAGARGTIRGEECGWVLWGGVNFSLCTLNSDNHATTSAGDGYAAAIGGESGIGSSLLFEWSTVFNCSGASGFRDWLTWAATVRYCNFYLNVAKAGTARYSELYAVNYGMTVSFCIFNGPTAACITGLSATTGFTLTACVFSRPMPDASFVASETRNIANTTTASLAIEHMWTGACPTALPEQTPAQSPEASSERSPEASSEQSPAASAERSPEATSEQSPVASAERSPVQTPGQSPEGTSERSPVETPDGFTAPPTGHFTPPWVGPGRHLRVMWGVAFFFPLGPRV
jgi:hypothetical protein